MEDRGGKGKWKGKKIGMGMGVNAIISITHQLNLVKLILESVLELGNLKLHPCMMQWKNPEFVDFRGLGFGEFINVWIAVASPQNEGVRLSDIKSFLAL